LKKEEKNLAGGFLLLDLTGDYFNLFSNIY